MGPIRTARAAARMTTRTGTRSASALVLALLAAACSRSSSSEETAVHYCPDVTIVRDLSLITRFEGSAPAFSGEIVSAIGECSFDDGAVEIETEVTMVYDRPVGSRTEAAPIAFFVAVARPDGTVIGKEEFASTVDFRGDETRAGFREQVSVTVPLPGGPASAGDYTVYVGFQLSQQELDYNRQRTR
jgi:hypothetical protein